MGTTPIYALPYVDPGSIVANFPAADKAQAEAVEAALLTGNDFGWAKASANQSIPSGTATPLSGMTLDGASRGVTLVGGNALRVARSGLYLAFGILTFSHNTTGARSAFFKRNSTNYLRSVGAVGTNSTGSIYVMFVYPLVTGDTISLDAYQSSGAALNTDFGSNGCSFQIVQM